MKCKVVGKSVNSFIDRSTGEVVDYSFLYVVAPFPKVVSGNAVCTGERALDVRCPAEILDDVGVGDTVNVDFDDKGKFFDLNVLIPAAAVASAPKADNKGGK